MSQQLTRSLTAIEQACELLNRLSGSYNVVTISTIQGALEPETLQKALQLSLQRQAPLRSIITGTIDNLRFVPRVDPQIELQSQSVDGPEAWQSVVQTELNTPINSSQSLIRAIWLRQANADVGHLITTLHHATCDGLSSIQLHRRILSDCQALLAEPTVEQSSSPLSPWPAPVPATSLFPASHQGLRGRLTSLLWAIKFKRKLRQHQPVSLSFEQTVPISQRQCGFLQRSLDASQVEALRSRCRQEQTSVQAALCAAMLISLAEPLQVKRRGQVPVLCRSFVDLRRHLDPPVSQEQLCLLASSLSTFHTLTEATSFWELARDVKQQLQHSLAQKEMFSSMPMLKKIVEAMLERPNETSITAALTNVGAANLPSDYGPLRLKTISFVPAQATFGGVFSAAVTTFQGKMQLNFMFSTPSLSHETVAALADELLVQLSQAISIPV